MSNKTIKTYSGIDKYAFISYSHKDLKKVVPVIETLCEGLIRLWYDAGIEIGSNWPDAVATHLLCSNTVVFFISGDFLSSRNCQNEVNYAVDRKKNAICVLLDGTELPAGMAMQLSVSAVIDGRDGDLTRIAEELKAKLGSDFVGDGVTGYTSIVKRKKGINAWRLVSVFLIIAVVTGALGIYGYFNDWFENAGFTKETVTDSNGEELEINSFKDSLSLNILMKSYSGESLYLCGNTMVSDGNAIIFKDGKWLINNEIIEKGSLSSCDAVTDIDGLIYLSLTNESIEDFGALSEMTELAYLDISGNPVKDLSFLKNMKNLKVLKLIDIEATDYSVVEELEGLQYLYIGSEQLDAVKNSIDISVLDVIVK